MYRTRMKGNSTYFSAFEHFFIVPFFCLFNKQKKLRQMSVVITMSENGINLQAESCCTAAAQEEEHALATIGWPRRSFFISSSLDFSFGFVLKNDIKN